jgi:hypothetical protein
MNILQSFLKPDTKPDHLEFIAVLLTCLIYFIDLCYVLKSSHTSYFSYISIIIPALLVLFKLVKEIFTKKRKIIIFIYLMLLIILSLLACCKKLKWETK